MQLYTAVRNLQLYPPTNPQVNRALDIAYNKLKKIQKPEEDGLTLAESEHKLLINGQALADRDMHRPQVIGIIEFLTGFGVHSIKFKSTIDRADFRKFIELFVESSSTLQLDSNLKELLAEKKIQHISVDTKRYVAIHDGQEVIDGNERAFRNLSVSDDELALFVSATGEKKDPSGDGDQFNTVLQMVLSQLRTAAQSRTATASPSRISPGGGTIAGNPSPGESLSSGSMVAASTSTSTPQPDGPLQTAAMPTDSSASGPSPVLADTYDHLVNILDRKEGTPEQSRALDDTATIMASLNDEDLEWLLAQPITKPVTQKLYTKTLQELDKDTLIRVAAGLKHKAEILHTRQDTAAHDKSRILKEAYMRLLRTTQGKEIDEDAARHADARLLLESGELPAALAEDLKNRLKQPEWSSAVLLAGIETLVRQTGEDPSGEGIGSFAKALAVYDSVLVDENRDQVVKYAATKMAAMDDGTLEWFFRQPTDTAMAEELYRSTFEKLSKDALIRIASHLKLQADIHNSENNNQAKNPGGAPIAPARAYERLLQLSGDPDLDREITRHADFQLLSKADNPDNIDIARRRKRLKDPEWSSSILLSSVEQLLQSGNKERASAMRFAFTNTTAAFDSILDDEEKEQLAKKAAADLAGMDEKILGLLLVQRFKGVFGEKLYAEVVKRMGDDKFEQLARQFDSVGRSAEKMEDWEGADAAELRRAYERLMQTVRGEKMRLVMEIYKKKEQEQRRRRLAGIKSGIKQLINGNAEILADEELVKALPATLLRLIHNRKERLAETILKELLTALDNPRREIAEAAASCLAPLIPRLTGRKRRHWLEKICSRVDGILRHLDPRSDESREVVATLRQIIRRFIYDRHYGPAEDFLTLLHQTLEEQGRENRDLVFLVEKTLAEIADHDILTRLLEEYLHNAILRKEAGAVLTKLGKPAAEHLLKSLEQSENKAFRMRLIHLLSTMQSAALEVLLEQLNQEGPWYFKRNILRLLGAVGDETCVDLLTPYLSHEDLRVQRETLHTINAIGGRHRKKMLLSALKTVPDPLKAQVVVWLGELQSDTLVYPLVKLLENRSLFSSKVKEELQEAICNALGRIGSPKATPALRKIIREKSLIGITGYSARVRDAAGRALEKIGAHQHMEKKKVVPLGKKRFQRQTADTRQRQEIITTREKEIFQLVDRGEKERAKQMLFDLVVSCARRKDFQNAERLRDKLYEIDSLALPEIIKSGEIIEQEKTDSIDADELETWRDLYEELSTEEFNAVFQNLEKRHYSPEQAIIRQGADNEELIFINKGAVKVFYRQDNRDIFIKNLGPGDLAAENFFESSVWTVSLAALTVVDLAVFNRKILTSWRDLYPGLESKLRDFCREFTKIHGQLNKKGLNRRAHERFSRSPKIKFRMCDQTGKSGGKGFRGELADISQGGLAFLIRISRKENARLLLGRSISIAVPLKSGPEPICELEGYITAVQSRILTEGDYSIHVCFNELLSRERLQQIIA